MSCYILPAASTFVNVAAIYQPVVLGSPLWSAAGHQHSPNPGSLSSSLRPLPLDSSAVLAVLPSDTAAASSSSLRLDAAALGRLCTSTLPGDVTSLYHTHHQLQKQIDFRSAVTTCFRVAAKSSGPDFYRLRRLLRRAKRQAAGDGRDDAGVHGNGNDDSISRYPLYCIVCRVRLNAQLQAKQHYNGRSHARRVRLLYGAPAFTAGTASDPAFSSSTSRDAEVSSTTSTGSEVTSSSSSSVCGDVTSPRFPAGNREPVSCDVYCSACAVSFNSTTQARQHYLGKTHAKRLRTTFNDHPLRRHAVSRTFQKDASHSCAVCSAKPDDAVRNKHDFSNKRPHSYVKHSNPLSNSGRRHAKLPLAR